MLFCDNELHMERIFSKNGITILVSVAIILTSFFTGYSYGARTPATELEPIRVDNTEIPSDIKADFAPFWKVWRTINEKYIPPQVGTSTSMDGMGVTEQERVWGAIEGMVNSVGDPYTVFLPPEDAEIFESDISGNFEGVGMEIGVRGGILTVISPLEGSPAKRAGILPGDQILKINDTITSNLSVDEAVKLIRGKVGTTVTFTILRDKTEEPFEIKVTRAVIDIPTISTSLRSDGVYVVRLFNFSAVSPNLFRNALRSFIRAKTNKLVLDLRGNPGGYLEAAVDMASWFLPPGEVIVKEDFKNQREQIVYRSKGYDIFTDNLKMVILIDSGSASAAEILAGSLREHGVAQLVGTQSYGKGSVQELVRITPETSLKVTIARWLTPNGLSISEQGLTPDVVVEYTEEDQAARRDPQMAKAVELLHAQ